MKILHTADLHLQEDKPETVDALEKVLDEAEEREVDLLTIGGDLFDTPEDAEALRPQLRDLFKDNPYPILAIPGNHDEDVYRQNRNFGEDIEVLTDTPYDVENFDGVEVIGVPFQSSLDDELFYELKEKSSEPTQILLLHCTLDIGFQSGAAGDEGAKYFPVTKATLAELDYEFVLAGHIHSRDREIPLDNGGTFIYPGSPVSHSTKETGRRNAILINTEEGSVSNVPLETFYYDSYSEMARPGMEDDILEDIRQWVARHEGNNCELDITVSGYIDRGENEFSEQLGEAAAPFDYNDKTQSVSQVLEHPLYQRFIAQLEERGVDDEEIVKTRVIKVLSQLMAQNKVQTS